MEKYGFFDNIPGDERAYPAEDWANMLALFLTSGIKNGGTNLEVVESSGMTTVVKPGFAMVQGYWYELTLNQTMTFEASDPTLDRIDRVVLRLDKTLPNRYAKLFVRKGTPDASPLPPALQRDENVFEISLAQVFVLHGVAFIDAADITDERLNTSVCGLINSLIQADTTDIFNQFQGWYDTRTAEYEAQWTSFTDQMDAEWVIFKSTKESDYTSWLNGLASAWDTFFGATENDGVRGDWSTWYTDAKQRYSEVAYEQNAILLAMGGY